MSFDFLTLGERLDELEHLRPGPQRGAALERLMEELLGAIPGVSVTGRDVITGHSDKELELRQEILAGHGKY